MFTTQLLLSITRILNVLLVLGIVLFSFAVAGVEFFGDVRYGAFLNGNRNFDDIPNTLMMLVRVTFSEWVYARHDCRVQPPGCTEGYDCGSVMGTPYFALLLLLNAYILANMFVAVVLTDFTWLVSHHPAYFTVTVLSLSRQRFLILILDSLSLSVLNLTLTQSHTHTHSLSLVPFVMMKSKELKTNISHAHSLMILSRCSLRSPIVLCQRCFRCAITQPLCSKVRPQLCCSGSMPLKSGLRWAISQGCFRMAT